MSWMVRMDGAVERKSLGCLSMIAARCGGMFTATSISPFWSAAPPVPGVRLQDDLLVLLPADERVGSGADRILRDVGDVLVLVGLRWIHRTGDEVHHRREGRHRLLRVHVHGVG